MTITNKTIQSSNLLEYSSETKVGGNGTQINEDVISLTENTTKNAMDLIGTPESSDESIENNEEMLFQKLDVLWNELKDALRIYARIFNEESGYVDISYIDLEYPRFPERRELLNSGNIEANAIFANVELENPLDVAFYNSLVKRLKEKDSSQKQAHLLGLIDLLNTYAINKRDKNSGRVDSSGNFVTNEYLNIVFGNPKLNSDYKLLIERMFDLMDKDSKLIIGVSTNLHKVHGKKLSPDNIAEAHKVKKIFE